MRADVVLLAAGKSTRAGGPKGMIGADGVPWIRRQVEALQTLELQPIVVLGFHARAYLDALAGTGAWWVENPTPELGQFSSIQTGLRQTSQHAFVLPLDTPCPHRRLWEDCLSALTPEVLAVTPEFGGRGGHPVLIARPFVDLVLRMPPTERLDEAIRGLEPRRHVRVPSSDGRLVMNLNHAADFSRPELA